jgi:hypothetical protein
VRFLWRKLQGRSVLLLAVFDYWTSPDSDPWLMAAHAHLADVTRNHPNLAVTRPTLDDCKLASQPSGASMAHYGIIVTSKVERDDSVIHFLKKGTVVEILPEGEVVCVATCTGVDVAEFKSRKHRQFVNPEDFIEIDPDQLAALRATAD